jgi:hypothetical protein
MTCEASASPIIDLYSLSKPEAYPTTHKHHAVDLLKGDRLETFGKRRKPKKGYLGFRKLEKNVNISSVTIIEMATPNVASTTRLIPP